jgi:phosphate transport system substrate-binding protein
MKRYSSLFTLVCLLSACAVPLSAQDVLRVHGANSIWSLLSKHTVELEQATGQKIAFVPNNTGLGLLDLAEGRCDMSMTTPSVDSSAVAANQAKPGVIPDTSVFKSAEIGFDRLVFPVHPSNSTPRLTPAQIKDIFTGKTTNWKEVGGPDTPIVVVSIGTNAGTWMALDDQFFRGAPITASAKVVKTSKDMNNIVSQVPGAIAYYGSNTLAPSVKPIETELDVRLFSLLVTKGPPTPAQERFIETARRIMGSK